MADDNSTAPAAPAHLRPADLLEELLKGAVQVSRRAVYDTMDQVILADHPAESTETLSAVEGTLALTEQAIERLYEQIEALEKGYSARAEVDHGQL